MRRWTLRVLVVFFLALNLLALPMAFTTAVVSPHDLQEPVTVYLLDHGITSSIVLPSEDGGEMIRYMYADWNYYVLDNRGFTDTLLALFWPTRASLGRQWIDGPPDVEGLRRQVELVTELEQIYTLQVERREAERLLARLERIVDQQRETLIADGVHDMEFVRHPQAYTYFHNSNHVTARWLSELECQTHGPAFNSRWRVAP